MKLFHGSENIIKEPLYGYVKVNNDYGKGFYLTKNIELAKEWACSEKKNGYVNEYELDIKKLKVWAN